MLLKKEPFKGCETPWDGDELERKQVADYLTPVIASIRQPFVIGLNSPYGTGKSFFIQHWKKQLESDGYKTVYFNAWESDYSDDALIAFISSIKEQLENNEETAQKLGELAKTGGAYLARKVLPIVAKGIARKVIGNKTVEEIVDLSEQTDEEIVDILGEVAEHSLKKHEAIKLSVESFKEYLEELVSEITQDQDDDDKKKLIIFVDELDRCKPTYALEVLECIKHLFSVNGVVFILAIDEEQLKSSIASTYGIKLDGESYLRKFIDWQLKLPKPSAVKYAAYLYNSFALEETGRFTNNDIYDSGSDMFIKMFGVFSYGFELTLREQAQCFTELNLFVRSLGKSEIPYAFLSAIVSVLRLKHRDKLEECIINNGNPEDLLQFLEGNRVLLDAVEKQTGEWWHHRKVLHAFLLDDDGRRELNEEYNELGKTDELEALHEDRLSYLRDVIGIHQQMRRGSSMRNSIAKYVLQKLEAAAALSSL